MFVLDYVSQKGFGFCYRYVGIKFVISREARRWWGFSGMSFIFCNVCCVFLILNGLGRESSLCKFSVNIFAKFYAGTLLKFSTGLFGLSVLCSLIRPFIFGAVEFMLMYRHFEPFGKRGMLSFTVFLIWIWNMLVGS